MRLPDRDEVRGLVKTVMSDRAALERLARLSFAHPNGFDRLVIASDPDSGARLRVHVWWDDDDRTIGAGHIHNHPWSFASRILAGRLQVETYHASRAARAGSATEDGGQLMFGCPAPLETRTSYRWSYIAHGRVRLDPCANLSLPTGSHYLLDFRVFHRVIAEPRQPDGQRGRARVRRTTRIEARRRRAGRHDRSGRRQVHLRRVRGAARPSRRVDGVTTTHRIRRLGAAIRRLYGATDALGYHGLAHIDFVRTKAVRFAPDLGADAELVEAAALTHDVNYLVDPMSSAADGQNLRRECLEDAGFTAAEIARIEGIVVSASSEHHGPNVSAEAQALADADMLFKALPATPLLFARDYVEEGGRSILEIAHELIGRQRPLLAEDRYFYSSAARRDYTGWAEINVRLWENLVEALQDPDIAQLVAQRLGRDPDPPRPTAQS